MTSTFFPINENTFIEEIMDDISNDKNDDWEHIFHTKIDETVSYAGDRDNTLIINEYAGDVFEAIKLYEDRYGDFEIPKCKHLFYARLAFISIYEKFYEIIKDKIN